MLLVVLFCLRLTLPYPVLDLIPFHGDGIQWVALALVSSRVVEGECLYTETSRIHDEVVKDAHKSKSKVRPYRSKRRPVKLGRPRSPCHGVGNHLSKVC